MRIGKAGLFVTKSAYKHQLSTILNMHEYDPLDVFLDIGNH